MRLAGQVASQRTMLCRPQMATLNSKALIFDLDGTLADSRLDFPAMRHELQAPADTGLLEYIEKLRCPKEQARAMDVVHRHEVAGAQTASWIPGAEETLHTLHRKDIPTAIVTRNSRRAAKLTMQRLGMPAIPLLAREDAAPKPDPEALLMLASKWQLEPAHCAFVGDFRYDIEAAERAGMQAILYVGQGAVPTEHPDEVPVLRDFTALLDWLAIAR